MTARNPRRAQRPAQVHRAGWPAQVLWGGRPAQLLAALALVWLATAVAAAAPGPSFEAYVASEPDRVLTRVDTLPDAEGLPFRLEARFPDGSQRLLGAPYAAAQRLYRLRDLPAGTDRLQLRLNRLVDGALVPGPWSAPVAIRGGGARDRVPGTLGADDWAVEADPDESFTLRVRLDRLPAAGDRPLAGLRLRAGRETLAVALAPTPGVWQRVALPPGTPGVVAGRPMALSLAAVSAAGTAEWSAPKTATTQWRGEPEPPAAFGAAAWFVRPSGQAGEILVETVSLPTAWGAPPLRLEARHAPTDGGFDPTGPWSGWAVLAERPAPDGLYRIGGLRGRDHLVQLRLVTRAGTGPAGAPKRAWTQSLDLPDAAVLGALNPAGSGRIRVPKGAQLTTVSAGTPADWAVDGGPPGWDYLVPQRPAAELAPDTRLDFAGGHRLRVTVAPAMFAAETPRDVARFLDLPARQKSGATLLIGPEWLDTAADGNFFANRLVGLSAPLTVRPREPHHGTLLTRWLVHTTRASMRAGNLRLEDLTFYFPEALAQRHRLRRTVNIVDAAHGVGRVAGVEIRDCRIFSDAVPGRLGYRLGRATRAIYLKDVADTVVEGCEISQVLYGISAGTDGALVRGNTVYHTGADPLNIHFSRGTAVRDVTIEHNTVHDFMGDAWQLHGDVLHMWMTGGGQAGPNTLIDGLRFRGNVGFPGAEGLQVPPRLPPAFKPLAVRGDVTVTQAQEFRILRVDASAGPAVVTLPPAEATTDRGRPAPAGMELAVQKADQGPHPVIIRRAPGSDDRRADGSWRDITLSRPWAAVLLDAHHASDGGRRAAPYPIWHVKVPVPAYQGFYADGNDVTMRDVVIEGNIIWGMAPSQIVPRNRPQDGVYVHNNTLLTPYPGDRDGDGRYNTRLDAATTSTGRISVAAWDSSVAVFDNIAGSIATPRDAPAGPATWNNRTLNWGDRGGIAARFPGAQPERPGEPNTLIFSPETRAEAIALARPDPGSDIARAGQGALGATADRDWWDFDTGQRRAGGKAPLAVMALAPAPGETSVAPAREALEITLTAPPVAGAGAITLTEVASGRVLQRWETARAAPRPVGADPADAGPDPVIAGRRLLLPLAAPLPADTELAVSVAPGALSDLWGRELAGLDAPWSFQADANAAINRLRTDDPSDPWWGARGWEEITLANGATGFTRAAGAGGKRLRLDSNRHGILYRSGTWTLRFDYGPVGGGANLRTEILEPGSGARVSIPWQSIRPGQPRQINDALMASRRDASARYGLPPGRVWTAELTWTRQAPPRRVIDLIEGAPDGAGMVLSRLMLHEGPAGQGWSAP